MYVDDFPRLQFDDEESNKRTEEEIRDLQAIAGPSLCGMSAQERVPGLSTASKWCEPAA